MHSQPFPSLYLAPLNLKIPNGTMAQWHFTGHNYKFLPFSCIIPKFILSLQLKMKSIARQMK